MNKAASKKKKSLHIPPCANENELKGRSWHISSFAGHMISVAIIQLYYCSVKAAMEMITHGSVSIKLSKNRQWAEFGMWVIV